MDQPVVPIVGGERDLADLYAGWLSGDYTVRTAYGDRGALTRLDETVGVALLDRRMSEMTDDEVLEGIRRHGFDFG